MDGKYASEPAKETGGAGPRDALAPLVDVLAASAGEPAQEISRRLREALPSAIAELAESNRRLRDLVSRRGGLVAMAASALREAAARLEGAAGGVGSGEAQGLRRLADELDLASQAPPEPVPAARPPSGGHPRVLVVDDEPDAREALAQVLEGDFEVVAAEDGQAAVDLARSAHPDLVLLDVNMPRLDGFQVLERLRGDPVTTDIPVIFVSARGDDAVKVRSLDLGAVDYLQKPFSERELRARVDRTLRLVRSQTALRELAQTDALTGLANLRAFRARIEEEVKRARRYRTPLTCVMADMDHLKPVNDQLGHAAGDRAIAAVSAVLRGELRETDFGARYGGDEFVILLPHTSAEEGRVFAERACARLRETQLEIGGRHVPLGASFGVACLSGEAPEDASDALLRAADAALYSAKRAGRGRVTVALGPVPGEGTRAGARP
ncbi:MAG TPA: diguanylate cyclase [Anaeromyxobacter sp.]|nr:diguanylate cyclase [Anaeromyxobacter sp.]